MHQDLHAHNHSHEHVSPAQRNAVLHYMLEHNQHHAEELHELGHQTEGEAAQMIHEAVALFEQSNEKLAAALKLLEEEA